MDLTYGLIILMILKIGQEIRRIIVPKYDYNNIKRMLDH